MNKQISKIISQVLSGDASTEDIQQLLSWFHESENNQKEFAQYEMLWNALEIIGRKHEFDDGTAYNKFIDQVERPAEVKKPASLLVRVLRIAAMIVLTSGLAFIMGYRMRPVITKAGPTCTVVAPKGSKAFAELPDGTRVWLNAESKLSYPATFSDESRNVYLEGESFFEVAKDKSRPFVVHTSGVNIRAIGTAFNVKSYPSEDFIQTTLVEGEVAVEKKSVSSVRNAVVQDKQNVVFLKPNQQATFYKTTSVIDVHSKTSVAKSAPNSMVTNQYNLVKKDSVLLSKSVDTKLFTLWKDNKLVFDNEPFESISFRLERQFNVSFKFMDEDIKSFRFTGKFNEISVEQLLSALQFASPFYYIIDENDIYLSLKPIQKAQ
ncbi:MAG: FecR domain-containing protein [Bacteroidales bacterium]